MQKAQKDLRLTYIFISHDLGVVRHISNRVGVMYLGKLVELTASEDLYAEPLHPYTQALLSSVPVPDPTFEREQIIILEIFQVPQTRQAVVLSIRDVRLKWISAHR